MKIFENQLWKITYTKCMKLISNDSWKKYRINLSFEELQIGYVLRKEKKDRKSTETMQINISDTATCYIEFGTNFTVCELK